MKEEKAKIDEVSQVKPKEETQEPEQSIKITRQKREHNPNDPTDYIPPKHKVSARQPQEKTITCT